MKYLASIKENEITVLHRLRAKNSRNHVSFLGLEQLLPFEF